MLLSGNNLTYEYPNGKRIFENFSISIAAGEQVGLTAPSGFGKTTLCALLSGYLKPLEGQVLLDNTPLSSYTGYCPVQMIWQHPQLAVNPRMKMIAILQEVPAIDATLCSALGIKKEWLSRFPGELSAGELQRFCIARALGKEARFILADEITAMLDAIAQNELLDFICAEAQHRGLGMLFVSHRAAVLNRACNRVIDLTG